MSVRYARVLGRFWGAAISAELEYRANFVVSALTSVLGLAGGLFGIFLFYRTGYTFAGWKWHEALAVLGAFTFLQGAASTVLTPNLSRIVQHVEQGTLDFVLLKPISSQFWLSLRALSPWGLPDVALGLGLMAYAGVRGDVAISGYFLALPVLLLGLLCLYSLWFVLGSTSIWFVRVQNVTEVLRGLLEAGRYPIVAFPAAYRFFFSFVVPVVFLTTVPAEALLGRAEWTWLAGELVLAVMLLAASSAFWRFALRYYTSASS